MPSQSIEKAQIPSPNSDDKQFSFVKPGETDRKTKILQSSIIIYKKKGINHSHIDQSPRTFTDCQDKPQQVKQEDHKIVYLEQLFCQHCLLEQPPRCRHCAACGFCIMTYDHHNYLLNRCIGEKNKLTYVLFLFAQLTQLVVILLTVDFYPLVTMGVTCVCICYISVHLFAQLFLIATNQTMIEWLTPEKLPYLKYAPDDQPRPFAKSFAYNVKKFFAYSCRREFERWPIGSLH